MIHLDPRMEGVAPHRAFRDPPMGTPRDLEALLSLQRLEAAVVGRQVVAPVLGSDSTIRVESGGLAWDCRLEAPFDGWGRFEVVSSRTARLIGPAQAWEREMAAGARVPLTMLSASWGVDLAASRIVRVHLADGVDPFDCVTALFDRVRYWLLARAPASREARALRTSLLPEHPHPRPPRRNGHLMNDRPQGPLFAGGSGLSGRSLLLAAYRQIWESGTRKGLQARLEAALRLAGASLVGWEMTPDRNVRVRWEKRGVTQDSLLAADDLTVLQAGFCLSGLDEDFDLSALVGVFEEGLRGRHA